MSDVHDIKQMTDNRALMNTAEGSTKRKEILSRLKWKEWDYKQNINQLEQSHEPKSRWQASNQQHLAQQKGQEVKSWHFL